MIATGLRAENWELLAEDRVKWKITCNQALQKRERKLKAEANIKRAKRKASARVAVSALPASGFIFEGCGRVGRSHKLLD